MWCHAMQRCLCVTLHMPLAHLISLASLQSFMASPVTPPCDMRYADISSRNHAPHSGGKSSSPSPSPSPTVSRALGTGATSASLLPCEEGGVLILDETTRTCHMLYVAHIYAVMCHVTACLTPTMLR